MFPSWFEKAEKNKLQQVTDDQNASMQGSYVDHDFTPYQLRQSLEPLHGEELEAFNWVIAKMEKDHPGLDSLKDLIDAAFDAGWFTYGDQGELRVVNEAPE